MIHMKINEAQTFQFDMVIDGKIKTVDSVSFVIESGLGYDIKVPARYNSNDRLIECDIPILEGILTDGEKNIRLELVVDGKFYTPLHDKIIIETPVRIVSKMIGELAKEIKEEEISVRVVSKMIAKSEPTNTSKMISEIAKETIVNKLPTSKPISAPAPVNEIKEDKSLSFSIWLNKPDVEQN